MKKAISLIVVLCAVAMLFAGCQTQPENESLHSLTHIEGVAATCTTSGKAEFWFCSHCSESFADAEGTQQTSHLELFIPALKHEAAEDDGDCTTAVTCVRCPEVMVKAKDAHTFAEEANEDGSFSCVNSGCTAKNEQ